MLLYGLLFGLILFISFLEITNIKKQYITILLITFSFILIMLSSIRWQTGTDWGLYYSFYHDNNSLNDFITYSQNPQGIELGYGLINLAIQILFSDYNILLMILAFFIISIKLRWMLKYTIFPATAVFINFSTYFGDIFFIRQIVALAITLIAFNYIIKKQKYIFIILILIASTVHLSSLIFIPAYWIYHSKISIKLMSIILIITILLDVTKFNTVALDFILNNFPSDEGKVLQKLHEYYSLNQSGENFGQAVDNSVRMLLALIRRLFFIPIYIYCLSKLSKLTPYYRGCFNLVMFGHITFFVMSMISIDFAGRLSMYYYVYELLLISSLLAWKDTLKYRLSILFIITLYCLMKYGYLIYSLHEYYLPYTTVF